MIRALLKKLRGVSKKRNLVDAPVPLEISNDELVTAYEWVVNGHLIGVPVATDAVCGRVYRVSVPLSVDATLRKMGVR